MTLAACVDAEFKIVPKVDGRILADIAGAEAVGAAAGFNIVVDSNRSGSAYGQVTLSAILGDLYTVHNVDGRVLADITGAGAVVTDVNIVDNFNRSVAAYVHMTH